MLDIAGAVSGNFGVSEKFVSVTINLTCNYMSPHRAESVIAEGELIRATSSLFFTQSKLYDPEHKRLCATATGIYKRQER